LRLGLDGNSQIKQHPWFDGFDWQALQDHTMKAPYRILHEKNWDYNHVNTAWKDADIVEETGKLLMESTV
jgi:hypothetical protein